MSTTIARPPMAHSFTPHIMSPPLTCEPHAPIFQIDGLVLPSDVTTARFDGRRSLLTQVNQQMDGMVRAGNLGYFNAQQQQAIDLIRETRKPQIPMRPLCNPLFEQWLRFELPHKIDAFRAAKASAV